VWASDASPEVPTIPPDCNGDSCRHECCQGQPELFSCDEEDNDAREGRCSNKGGPARAVRVPGTKHFEPMDLDAAPSCRRFARLVCKPLLVARTRVLPNTSRLLLLLLLLLNLGVRGIGPLGSLPLHLMRVSTNNHAAIDGEYCRLLSRHGVDELRSKHELSVI
jgi:hypothetical protein